MHGKKSLILLFIVLLSSTASAQEWLERYNQSNEDYNNFNLEAAKENASTALTLFTQAVPGDHKNTTAILRHLSLICFELGSYDEGIEYALREKEMIQNLNGSDDENFAVTLYNLGLMYSANGQSNEALAHLQQAQDLMLVYHTTNELEVAEITGNIAVVLYYGNQWENCQAMFESSIAAMESSEQQSPEYSNILYVNILDFCIEIKI